MTSFDENFIQQLSCNVENLLNSFGFKRENIQHNEYLKIEKYKNNKLNFKIVTYYMFNNCLRKPYIKFELFPYSYEETNFDLIYGINNIHLNQIKRDLRKKIYYFRPRLQGNKTHTYFVITEESITNKASTFFVRMNNVETTVFKWADKIKSLFSREK